VIRERLTRTAKRKREEDKEKQEKINNGISKYFGAKSAVNAPKAKVRSTPLPLPRY
jgi:DNA polymerase alpha subunit A